MPTYSFRFIDEDGVPHTEDRFFKRFEDAPEEIQVVVGDATYTAKRVISLTAKMGLNWEVKGTSSDLPPENAPAIG